MYNHECASDFVNGVFLLFLPVRVDVVGVERRSEKKVSWSPPANCCVTLAGINVSPRLSVGARS